MKRSSIQIMILMMMAIQSALAQQDSNLVHNGTFEQGNVGFKSDFQFFSNEAFGRLLPPGSFQITNNFPDQENPFVPVGRTVSQNIYDSLRSYYSLYSTSYPHIQTALNPKGQYTG